MKLTEYTQQSYENSPYTNNTKLKYTSSDTVGTFTKHVLLVVLSGYGDQYRRYHYARITVSFTAEGEQSYICVDSRNVISIIDRAFL